ncbi:MAG: hypothetical protein ACQEXJ_05165 [Myxococcota bacterium]
MQTGRRWRRRRDLAAVSDLLPRARWARRASWQTLVGATLAESTALVGVDDEGRLRVMAANETACRELLAREAHVLAAWNARATRLRARRAETLVCWVRPGLKTRPAPRTGPAPEPPPPEPRQVEAAEILVGEVRDPGVRSALVEMRARALRRAERERSGGESPAGGRRAPERATESDGC